MLWKSAGGLLVGHTLPVDSVDSVDSHLPPDSRLSDSSSSEEEDFGESIFDPLVA